MYTMYTACESEQGLPVSVSFNMYKILTTSKDVDINVKSKFVIWLKVSSLTNTVWN